MKKTFSERDICTKYITPAVQQAGWDVHRQIREEVSFTAGRVIVRGKLHTRGQKKRADYILYYKPNIPIALIEAKDNSYSVSAGMQQALAYAEALDIPFIYSSNGDAFMEHDRTVTSGAIERELTLDNFPSPTNLWMRYCTWKNINAEREPIITLPYRAGLEDTALLSNQCHQQNHRSYITRTEPHSAGHGYRHRKNLHGFPNHLAALEIPPEKTHPLSRRPQHSHRPNDD
jgi:type I site-specific restriction endonuclease